MAGYLVLARKYRPRTFQDVIGQEVVTRVLTGALEEDRVGHAYLFSGPRGTGKTTTARILAKCLNCEQGPTATPCDACEHCRAFDEGTAPDLIEIDAATHTGVDHVRELREQATYAPMRARTKVYIIDEVHMLSKAAFNALLKTLEEPPPHVVFLFATTELHKVIGTIVSRCQVLKLAPISEATIAARLTEVLSLEGVTPGPGIVEEIARGAAGGMRDALSLCDKLLALAGAEPTLEDLRRLGGHTGARELEDLLGKVEAGDKPGLLAGLPEHEGGENELLAALLGHLRKSLLAAYCGEDSPLLPAGEAERGPVLERARRLDPERIELWMQELLHARERMRLFPGQERLVLELTLLDLARPEATMPLAELEARLRGVQVPTPATAPAPAPAPAPAKGGPGQADTGRPAPETAPAAPATSAAPPAPTTSSGTAAAPAQDPTPAPATPSEIWNLALQSLASSHGALADLLLQRARFTLDGGDATLRMARLSDDERALANDRRNRAALKRALEAAAGTSLSITMKAEDAGGPGNPAPPPVRSEAPPAPVAGGEETAAEARNEPEPSPEEIHGAREGTGGARDDAPPGDVVTPTPAPEAPPPAAAETPKATPAPPSPEKSGKGMAHEVADLFGGVIEDLP